MAIKRTTQSYDFAAEAKASMIPVLDQFGTDLVTVHEIKEMLRVPGSVVLDAHYAVILARLVAPHYPAYAEKLLTPLETYPPAHSPNEQTGRFFDELDRIV